MTGMTRHVIVLVCANGDYTLGEMLRPVDEPAGSFWEGKRFDIYDGQHWKADVIRDVLCSSTGESGTFCWLTLLEGKTWPQDIAHRREQGISVELLPYSAAQDANRHLS